MVCGDFNAHNTEWLCQTHATDVAGLLCEEFAMMQDFTQPTLFLVFINDPVEVLSRIGIYAGDITTLFQYW